MEPEGEGLAGREVAVTGRLASMSRQEATARIRARGGRYVAAPGPETDYLVVGEAGWPLKADGRLTHHLEAARLLRAQGSRLAVISEPRFLNLAGVQGAPDHPERLYTAQQLAGILRVPPAQVAAWVRQGLIQPRRSGHNMFWFDFQQVASARALCELLRAGVSPTRIRWSLRQVERWWPGAAGSLAQLGILGQGGRLLLRLDGGALAEPDGQLRFDFGAAGTEGPRPRPAIPLAGAPARDRSPEGWFDLALQLEEADRFEEAADAYQESLMSGGPCWEACFNLGNILYRLGRKAEAAQRFFQTVELDPGRAEAWNNLGNALGDLGRLQDAIRALDRACTLAPRYADAHYNLAETLLAAGDAIRASRHWRRYLELDPESPWSDHVRDRLAALGAEPGPEREADT